MDRVDYDRVASGYDRRYRDGGPAGLAAFVRARCAPADDRSTFRTDLRIFATVGRKA